MKHSTQAQPLIYKSSSPKQQEILSKLFQDIECQPDQTSTVSAFAASAYMKTKQALFKLDKTQESSSVSAETAQATKYSKNTAEELGLYAAAGEEMCNIYKKEILPEAIEAAGQGSEKDKLYLENVTECLNILRKHVERLTLQRTNLLLCNDTNSDLKEIINSTLEQLPPQGSQPSESVKLNDFTMVQEFKRAESPRQSKNAEAFNNSKRKNASSHNNANKGDRQKKKTQKAGSSHDDTLTTIAVAAALSGMTGWD